MCSFGEFAGAEILRTAKGLRLRREFKQPAREGLR